MINTRPDLPEMIEQAKPEQKTELSEALWSHAANHGTPLVTKDHNGFQALFLYRSNKANLSVRLKSADLHDRLTKDSKDGQTELFQHISGTDIYYLKVSGLPANACAEYSIQVGDSQNSTTVTDRYNKHPASNQKLDLSSNIPVFITDSVTYMKMPEAVIPASSHIKDKYKIKLSRETFHSDRYKQFQDRNVFTYQSDDFQPQSGKVIFMLDGEDSVNQYCQA